jgi:hypothetical protein
VLGFGCAMNAMCIRLGHLESPGPKSSHWLQCLSIYYGAGLKIGHDTRPCDVRRLQSSRDSWTGPSKGDVAANHSLPSGSGRHHGVDPEPAFTPWSRHPRLGALQRVFQGSPSTPLIPIPLSLPAGSIPHLSSDKLSNAPLPSVRRPLLLWVSEIHL